MSRCESVQPNLWTFHRQMSLGPAGELWVTLQAVCSGSALSKTDLGAGDWPATSAYITLPARAKTQIIMCVKKKKKCNQNTDPMSHGSGSKAPPCTKPDLRIQIIRSPAAAAGKVGKSSRSADNRKQ